MKDSDIRAERVLAMEVSMTLATLPRPVDSDVDDAAIARSMRGQLSLAEDCLLSNRALMDVLADVARAVSAGGFASATEQLAASTAALHDHTERSTSACQDAAQAIRAFSVAVSAFEAGFHELQDLIAGVKRMTGKITSIASQSSILSLNARIEASRAGAAGKGFEVVAREVGALSKETSALSDDVTGDMERLEATLNTTQQRFAASRAELERAAGAVGALESAASGIRDEAQRLCDVSDRVETIAYAQVGAQNDLEAVARHAEWVRDASVTLVDSLQRSCARIEQRARATPASAATAVIRDFEQFERLLGGALQAGDPELGAKAAVRAQEIGLEPRLVLEALSRAVANSALARVGKELPLEAYYREGFVLRAVLEVLEPKLAGAATPGAPTVVLGNAYEDHHDLGRRLVALNLRAAGCRVVDLGLSVRTETFVETAVRENADVVGVSALLLHTAQHIPALKRELARRGRADLPVIAGGAIFLVDPQLRERFEVDGVGRTPDDAVRLVFGIVAAKNAARSASHQGVKTAVLNAREVRR